MRRKTMLALLTLATGLFVLAGCGGDDDGGGDAGGDADGGEVTVTLAEQNGSGQSGTATLSPAGEGATLVVLEIANPGADPQPVHIHAGSCAELGDVAYPLANLEGGASESTVNVALADIQGGGFAINAHESEANIANYTACGDIA